MKKVVLDGLPHLALFASRDLEKEEQLLYDYDGDDLPWRAKGTTLQNVIEMLLLQIVMLNCRGVARYASCVPDALKSERTQ